MGGSASQDLGCAACASGAGGGLVLGRARRGTIELEEETGVGQDCPCHCAGALVLALKGGSINVDGENKGEEDEGPTAAEIAKQLAVAGMGDQIAKLEAEAQLLHRPLHHPLDRLSIQFALDESGHAGHSILHCEDANGESEGGGAVGSTSPAAGANGERDSGTDSRTPRNRKAEAERKKISYLEGAVRSGNFRLAVDVVSSGANPLIKTRRGESLLMLAAATSLTSTGAIACVDFLLEAQVMLEAKDGNGDTALMHACHSGKVEVVQHLLRIRAEVNAQGDEGRTPLMIAILEHREKLASLLLEHRAEVSAQDTQGWTPLFYAVREGLHSMAKWLFLCKAHIQERSKDNYSALMVASEVGNLRVGRLLLRRKAQLNGVTMEGRTPLMTAILAGKTHFANFLLDEGADIMMTDAYGMNPYQMAEQEQHRHLVNRMFRALKEEEMKEKMKMFKKVLKQDDGAADLRLARIVTPGGGAGSPKATSSAAPPKAA